MKIPFRVAVALATILLAASAVPAQFGMRQPTLSGIFSPSVGDGAAYEMTTAKEAKKTQMDVAIVGKEDYEGKSGYWEEISISGTPQGTVTMKMLISVNENQIVSLRTVMQMGGEVMEFDNNSPMMQNRQKPAPADVRKSATRVGSETITVPAGTYTCEHWKMNDGSGDAWLSDKVHPWGLVKATGPDRSMILMRQISGATTKLSPPYKKFDMQDMMRKSQQHP